MEEIQQTYPAPDPEATVVQPRFDASEAQTAQPVVPLSRVAAWRGRRLPLALVLVSALVGGLVSVLAYRLYQRAAQAHAAPRPAAVAAQPTPTPELTAAAPPKEEAAPAEPPREAAPRAAAPAVSAPAEGSKKEAPRAAATTAAPARAEVHADAPAPTEERRHAGVEAARPRRETPRAVRVDVITSPEATERVVRERGRGDGAGGDDQPRPDRRDGRRGRNVKGRNIDRIRDIFGAPPPG
jgi:hypothetical protein